LLLFATIDALCKKNFQTESKKRKKKLLFFHPAAESFFLRKGARANQRGRNVDKAREAVGEMKV
jgi:hypothetical protein